MKIERRDGMEVTPWPIQQRRIRLGRNAHLPGDREHYCSLCGHWHEYVEGMEECQYDRLPRE